MELSYCWTRKAMNSNVRSTAILGSDRSLRDQGADDAALGSGDAIEIGNHQDGWNVLRVDGTVEYIGTGYDPMGNDVVGASWLAATSKGGGFLAIYGGGGGDDTDTDSGGDDSGGD